MYCERHVARHVQSPAGCECFGPSGPEDVAAKKEVVQGAIAAVAAGSRVCEQRCQMLGLPCKKVM
jgi:hypothetical protein